MAAVADKQEDATLKSRLDWAEKTLYAMLRGDKPAIDIRDPEQSWLFEQMTRMYKAGFLCEEPESYVTLPGEEGDAEIARYKGVTIREPMPKQLTSEVKDLGDLAQKRDVKNFRVFGADSAYRYRREPLEQLQDADGFVLTKGGTVELYQWVVFLRAQLESAAGADGKVFVVQNADRFWDPALNALQVPTTKAGDKAGKFANLVVTDTRHDTLEALETRLPAGSKTRVPRPGDDAEILGPRSNIFFVTGNRKKVNDYKKVFRRRGTDVDCFWFQQKFDKPEGADEFSYSYVGNLVEKIEKFYLHIRDHYGPDGFREAMAAQGFDIEKSFLWFDDSGLELAENLTGGPEFADCSYRMNPYKKHGPAAEMKNAINAMQNDPFRGERATRGMMKRIEAAAERLYDQRVAAGEENPEVSRDCFDRNCVAIVPINDLVAAIEDGASFADVMEKVPMHFFQSRTEQELIFSPRPDSRAVDTKNFLVAKKDPDQRTHAENPHYVAQHSITAQVVKAAARVLGFARYESEPKSLSAVFGGKAGQAWRLGTQHSIHKNVNVHGIGSKTTRQLRGLYNLMAGNGGRFDVMRQRDHVLRLEDDSSRTMRTGLNNFYDFTLKADGFMLTPDSQKVAGDEFFWHRTFMFFSLIVGRQINDKTVTSKPLVVVDSPTWRPYMGLMEHYGAGLIPEMPHEIIDAVIDPKKDLPKNLNKVFAEYQPDQVPDYTFTEGGQKCPAGLFRVTVYCSASTTSGSRKAWSRDFAFDCGALGFAMKNGGGTGPDGLMIETSCGILDVKGDFDAFLKRKGLAGAPKTHIASIQCVDTAQEEGLCKFNDYWAVYPTIYQRMHELQDADAEVVLPGGAGTIQEIAASVLMRKAGIYPVENRPLIIVNHEEIYEPFLKMIPAQDFARYNIHVVKTSSEALELLVEARKSCGMEPALPYSRGELIGLKQEFQTEKMCLKTSSPGNNFS